MSNRLYSSYSRNRHSNYRSNSTLGIFHKKSDSFYGSNDTSLYSFLLIMSRYQSQKKTLSTQYESLTHCSQSLKYSLPLVKYGIEKVIACTIMQIELELLDIHFKLREEDLGTFFKEKAPTALSLVREKEFQIMSRGNNILKQPILKRINELQETLKKLKENYASVDRAATSMGSAGAEISRIVERMVNLEGSVYVKQLDETLRQSMNTRVQELEELNRKLRAELANAELYKSKSIGYSTGNNRSLEREYMPEQHYYTRQKNLEVDLEKMELSNRASQLANELEATKQLHKGKIAELQAQHRNKLINIYHCITQFLAAMHELQLEVTKQNDSKLQRCRTAFELEKTRLIQLTKDLKLLDNGLMQEFAYSSPSKKTMHSRYKSGLIPASILSDYGHRSEEGPSAYRENSRWRASNNQSKSAALVNEGDYSEQSSKYGLKKRIGGLEAPLNEKMKEVTALKHKQGNDLKLKLRVLLKKAEEQAVRSLSKLEHKIIAYLSKLNALSHKNGMASKKLKAQSESLRNTNEALAKELGNLKKVSVKEKSEYEEKIKEINKRLLEVAERPKAEAECQCDEIVLELKKKEEEIAELNTRISKLAAEHKEQLNKYNGVAESLRREMDERDEAIGRFERMNGRLITALDMEKRRTTFENIGVSKEAIKQLEKKINELTFKMSGKDELIQGLKTELAGLHSRIKELENNSATKNDSPTIGSPKRIEDIKKLVIACGELIPLK
eukprot:TRINITY_DN4327_c0_g2_i8.p1 TRINITY_DN4327_c0_g2~~TRINITY_DN4327_c0_g2_i8.p1  ORF type:complete len:731 (+),score=168.38 TRINITY_DN4327_c0_g2_i8:180-2372(+)